MLDKDKIIREFKKKIHILKKHNHYYHNQDKPKITDREYDILKDELIVLEKKFTFLKKLNLLNLVGSPPTNKFNKIRHISPMLSLNNAFNKDDMKNFYKKINNFLNLKNEQVQLFSEPKIDGISATLVYENGKLTKGLSRGDGTIGEDILNNLKTIQSIPKEINQSNLPSTLEIRCEVYIWKK